MNVDEEIFLSAYIDGELTPGQRLRVESALVTDPRLAEDLRALSAVRDLISGLPRPHLSCDVAVSVVARLDRRRRTVHLGLRRAVRPDSLGARAAALVAAAAAVVALAAVGLVGALHDPPAAPTRVVRQVNVGGPTRTADEQDPVDLGSADEGPQNLAPGRVERRQEREHRQLRTWLDSPRLRKLFIVTDTIGDADRKVGEIIEKTPRRHLPYGRMTVAQGIVMDPDHPGRAVVFALVMDDREVREFRETLRDSFRDTVEETAPRPEFVTQLADVGQMAVLPGRSVARLIPPELRERERERARRTNTAREHETKARLLPEVPGLVPAPVDEVIVDQRDGPTPEQLRSGPHPSLRPAPVAAGPALADGAGGADGRPDEARPEPQGSVVLVMVTGGPARRGRAGR